MAGSGRLFCMTDTRTLSEYDSALLLGRYGIATARFRHVVTAADAALAADDFDGPVAVKLCGASIAHKTERGLVRLGVQGADALGQAATELLERATRDDGEVGIFISSMIVGRRELIAGAVQDANFGPTVMLGIGGIFAEALADVVFRLAPIEECDALEMIEDLRSQELLGALRGEPPVCRSALARVVRGLAEAILREPDVVSIDVNPLIVSEGKPVAVDALVEVRV